MSADLNLTVGAEIGNLTANLDKASAKVKQFARESGSALSSLDAKGFKPMVKGADQASFALTNLGRVAQDAPFGFIGIANNINPLIESFQRLQKETGSTAGTLKALASGLAGAGGIGLAISAGTAVLSLLGMAMQKTSAETREAKKENDKYAESLKAITGEISKEYVQISAIVRQLQLEKLSREERNGAIKELQRLAPEYFNTLNTEKASIVQITAAYDKYAASITRTIEARVIEKQLQDVVQRRIELQKKAVDFVKEEVDEQGKLRRATNVVYENEISKEAEYQRFRAQRGALSKRENIELKNLQLTEKKLLDQLSQFKLSEIGVAAEKVKIKGVQKIEIERIALNEVQPFTSELYIKVTAENIRNAQREAEQKLKDTRLIFPAEIKPILDIKTSPLRNSKYKLTPEEIIDIEQWSKTIGEIKTDLVGELINGLTASITNGGGGLRDTFKSLLTLVGDFLIQLGKGAVKAALVAQALKLLQKNPITGLIAGLSAIALGSLIKNTIPKFATGVQNFRGGTALVGERGPELLTLPKGSNITPNDKLGGAGGGIAVSIYGEFRQRGTDMVAVIATTQRSNARRF